MGGMCAEKGVEMSEDRYRHRQARDGRWMGIGHLRRTEAGWAWDGLQVRKGPRTVVEWAWDKL